MNRKVEPQSILASTLESRPSAAPKSGRPTAPSPRDGLRHELHCTVQRFRLHRASSWQLTVLVIVSPLLLLASIFMFRISVVAVDAGKAPLFFAAASLMFVTVCLHCFAESQRNRAAHRIQQREGHSLRKLFRKMMDRGGLSSRQKFFATNSMGKSVGKAAHLAPSNVMLFGDLFVATAVLSIVAVIDPLTAFAVLAAGITAWYWVNRKKDLLGPTDPISDAPSFHPKEEGSPEPTHATHATHATGGPAADSDSLAMAQSAFIWRALGVLVFAAAGARTMQSTNLNVLHLVGILFLLSSAFSSVARLLNTRRTLREIRESIETAVQAIHDAKRHPKLQSP